MLSDKQIQDIALAISKIHGDEWGFTRLDFARAIERAARAEAFEEVVEEARLTDHALMYWAEAKAKEAE